VCTPTKASARKQHNVASLIKAGTCKPLEVGEYHGLVAARPEALAVAFAPDPKRPLGSNEGP